MENSSLRQQLALVTKQREEAFRELSSITSRRSELHEKMLDLELEVKRARPIIDFHTKFRSLNPFVQLLIQNEIDNKNRAKNGHRYAPGISMFCIYLHFSSPKMYRFFKSVFTFPSTDTLMRQANTDLMKTGLNDALFGMLKKCELSDSDRICSLLIDEVSIRPELSVNHRTGEVIGKADLAGIDAAKAPAKSALTMMLCSPTKSLKIPIAFYFSHSAVTGDQLQQLVTEAILKLLTAGIRVHSLICDQGSSNQKLAKNLNISLEKCWFDVRPFDQPDVMLRVFFFFDTPHCMKAFRNNLHKYQLTFVDEQHNTRTADWKFIRTAYKIDQQTHLSLFPRITAKHIDPTYLQKMSVKHAVQVLSNSFSSGMKVLNFLNWNRNF